LLVALFISFSLYSVIAQPDGAPTPTVFLNGGTRSDIWVWPLKDIQGNTANAVLQPGVTYQLTYTLTLGGSAVQAGIVFTVQADCPVPSPNNPAGPSGNHGWRVQFTQAAENAYNGLNIWTSPTGWGNTVAGKCSFTFDEFDVCDCIFVNYIFFTTTDPLDSGYGAHYWNGGSVKREERNHTLSKRCKREDFKERDLVQERSSTNTWSHPHDCPGMCITMGDEGAGVTPYWPCCFWSPATDCGFSIGAFSVACGPSSYDSFSNPPAGCPIGGQLAKRTSNFYVYYINANQNACFGLPTVGSYGTGGVQAAPALAVTYF